MRYGDNPLLEYRLDNEEWETGEPPRHERRIFAEPMSSYARSGVGDGIRTKKNPHARGRFDPGPLDEDDWRIVQAAYDNPRRMDW